MQTQVFVRSLVFIGGGHAHVDALKSLGMKPIPGVQITLITRDVNTPYSGMLPGHIAGHYTREECHIDLQKVARFAGACLIHTEAIGLDREKRLVKCKDGRPPIRYDVLSIDIGSTPKFLESLNPDDLTRVTRVKPIDSFSARWDTIVDRVAGGSSKENPSAALEGYSNPDESRPRVVVVGGGAGGIELALSIQYRLKNLFAQAGKDPEKLTVAIVTRGSTVLSSHNSRVQRIFERVLDERAIEKHVNKDVVDVREAFCGPGGNDGTLVCADGTEVPFTEAIWCTHSGAASWLKDTGLSLNKQGFIEVNDFLESTNTPGVFAVGDCCHMVNHPRPKAGVFAVRQGPPLTDNIRRVLEGHSMKVYTPQKAFLGLISTGNKNAVLSWRNFAYESGWLWSFKDWIDVRWMLKYQELPKMDNMREGIKDGGKATPSLGLNGSGTLPRAIEAAGPDAIEVAQNANMRCGGCGSKVGAGVLRRVLSRLGIAGTPGEGLDDAAVISPPGEADAVMVQTVDFFRSFVSDAHLFGRIAGNHALSDIHAMGADATTALAIATIPFGGESQVEGTLEQLLAGALKSLSEAGCSLVGGHTCEGAELALGLTVNGVVRRGHLSLLRKQGASPGHVLIITKAVGTGAILAAEMRGESSAVWFEGAVQSMLQSNGPAADILREFGAIACTDVTGFGLVGHTAEMLQFGLPSAIDAAGDKGSTEPQLDAEINLWQVPVLPGAEEIVRDGITSTLQGQNERDNFKTVVLETKSGDRSDPRFRLLFDPQTAGGLLAAIPPSAAEVCVNALQENGYHYATVIGTFQDVAQPGKGGQIRVVAMEDQTRLY